MTTLRNLGRGSAITSLSAPELRRCFARKRRPTMTVTAKTQTLFLLLSLSLASCSNRSANCEDTATCKPEGGNGGTSGNASNGGTTKGGSTKGGSSSTATSKAPCNGECSRNTPVCDESTNQCVACLANKDCKTSAKPVCDPDQNACVACLKSTDCKDTAKPVCDTSTNACVACLANTDCPSATASRCDATTNACAACQNDSDCTQISGKNACSNGTCVQCTVANESACGGNSCNPKTSECTSTAKGSVTRCGSCVADSECATGGSVTVARCVPMTFNGSPHGNYCLEAVSSGCDQPFGNTSVMKVTAASVSGAAAEDYCGINQATVTCEAIRDMIDSDNKIRCGNASGVATDSLCGCHRDPAGACTDAGTGGLCRSINGANRCTIQCGGGTDCSSNYTCNTVTPPNYCG